MRIGVLDNTVSLNGGDVTWVRAVLRTLRESGHEVDHYRATAFQRDAEVIKLPGRRYHNTGILTPHMLEMKYDCVIVPETIHRDDCNWYLPTLKSLKGVSTLISGVHCTISAYRRYQFIEEPMFVFDRLWTTRLQLLEELQERLPDAIELPHLPFWADSDYSMQPVTRSGVLFTGRVASMKGHAPFFKMVAADVIEGDVTICGRSMMNGAQQVYERMLKAGAVPVEGSSLASPKLWQTPWEVELPSGRIVRYTGPYADASDIPWHLGSVHVDFTERTLSPGHLEYTTIEALSAGRRCLVPDHQLEGLEPYHGVTGLPFETKKDWSPEGVERAVNEALLMETPSAASVADSMKRHDPVGYTEKMLG